MENNFKVGDVVEVYQKTHNKRCYWDRKMDEYVGIVSRVTETALTSNSVKLDAVSNWWFPIESIRLISKTFLIYN